MVDADLAGGQKVCNSRCRKALEKRSKCEGRARLHEKDSRCVVGQEKRDDRREAYKPKVRHLNSVKSPTSIVVHFWASLLVVH